MPNGSKLNEKEIKEYKSMSLDKLTKQIQWCLHYSREGGTTSGRKSFFKRLIQLEKIREEVHNVVAPYRDFRDIK